LERPVLGVDAMVRLTVGLQAALPRSAQALDDALRFLMASTRLEPGCLECSVWYDRQSSIRYMERWASAAAMRRRVRSPGFTSLLAVMESADAPPLVQFDFITKTRSLDYVAEVRRVPDPWIVTHGTVPGEGKVS
jgi:quinol monooxygenase YgiN